MSKVMLVNAGFVKKLLEEEYGRPPVKTELHSATRAVQRYIPAYYTDREREQLGLYSHYWRAEEVEPFVRIYAREQMKRREKRSMR